MTSSPNAGIRQALHDINNSLNAIAMQAELAHMLLDTDDLAKVGDALDVIKNECKRAAACSRSAYASVGAASD